MMSLKGATFITPSIQGNLGCAAAPSLCIAFQVARVSLRHLILRSWSVESGAGRTRLPCR